MDAFQIIGGRPLDGEVRVAGAKNAALPIMAASILADGPVRVSGVPDLLDVRTLAQLLTGLGVWVRRDGAGSLCLDNVDPTRVIADANLVQKMRASFCVLGPLLARRGRAVVPLPGGCEIGDRPIDLHLSGLAALGVEISIRRGHVIATAGRLTGATVLMSGPRGPTVTGTMNVLSAATLARGETLIVGAAVEPEVVDLGMFLNTIGARIEGLGTTLIRVQGVEQLGGGQHTIIPDRIEAATLLMAAAITGGSVTVRGARADHMTEVLSALSAMGVEIKTVGERITANARVRPRSISLVADPYPRVPTDVQSQFTALTSVALGRSRIADRVFPERFAHVAELCRLGARIRRSRDGAIVEGVSGLIGASVTATDLRASAALVLAGLAAAGTTTVRHVYHLDRGYQGLEKKMTQLGAKIERVTLVPSDEARSAALANK
ncbi:MAG TPA: UDP-N-acetylglucosamine 1-carboxyvinyltransferase [Pirellulales bacterium]|jgi:UDP-N-acetylglucosamine 1-carboxyvinyltransferase